MPLVLLRSSMRQESCLGHDLAMMAADEFAVDLQIIVRRCGRSPGVRAAVRAPRRSCPRWRAECAPPPAADSPLAGRRVLHIGDLQAVGAGGEFDPLQFANRGIEFLRGDAILVLAVSRHQTGIAQRIDQSRHAAGIFIDGGVGVFGEYSPALRSGHLQTMIDVGRRLGLASARQDEIAGARAASAAAVPAS